VKQGSSSDAGVRDHDPRRLPSSSNLFWLNCNNDRWQFGAEDFL